MNSYTAPVYGISLPWVGVVSILLALLFPLSLYAVAGGIKNRARLLVASVAGFAATCILGQIRRDSFKDLLVIYSDMMLSAIIGGLIISFIVRNVDPNEPIETDKWTRVGYKIGGVLAVVIGALLFLEYGPI